VCLWFHGCWKLHIWILSCDKSGNQILCVPGLLFELLWFSAALSFPFAIRFPKISLQKLSLPMCLFKSLVPLACFQWVFWQRLFLCVWWNWGLNLGLHTCHASTLLFEVHLQSTFALVILEMRSWKLFALDFPVQGSCLVLNKTHGSAVTLKQSVSSYIQHANMSHGHKAPWTLHKHALE
jgi:hypothetical protein